MTLAPTAGNETFDVPVNADDDELGLSVYERDALSDDLIGRAAVPVDSLIEQGDSESWYTVGKGSKASGEVLLRAQHLN